MRMLGRAQLETVQVEAEGFLQRSNAQTVEGTHLSMDSGYADDKPPADGRDDLHEAPFGHAEHLCAGHDQVVEHADVHQAQRRLERLREPNVRL